MADKFVRISQLAPVDEVVPPVYKPKDFQGTDLLITSFEEREGDMGTYYLITCASLEDGVEFLVSCGGFKVKAQLAALKPDDLPVVGMFKMSGRSWYLA